MNRPRLLRALRITWTVFCGIACVLLIVLWVRSYYWIDLATGPTSTTQRAAINSSNGWLHLTWNHPLDGFTRWKVQHNSIAWIEDFRKQALARGEGVSPKISPSFGFTTTPSGTRQFELPHWFGGLLFAGLASLPWLRWRFGLRTLLIATTLIAVVLGLVMWSLR